MWSARISRIIERKSKICVMALYSHADFVWRAELAQRTRQNQPPQVLMGWVLILASHLDHLQEWGLWGACLRVWEELAAILDELAWRSEVAPAWADRLIGVGVPEELGEEFREKVYRRHWRVAIMG